MPTPDLRPPTFPPPKTSRRALRHAFLAQRAAMPNAARAAADMALCSQLKQYLLLHFDKHAVLTVAPSLSPIVALYHPHAYEPDLLALASDPALAHLRFALPVVVGAGQPLRFAAWATGESLTAGAYGIPVPAYLAFIHPDVLVLPCVAFTVQAGAAYRLGYGGGFYDRTVAQLDMMATQTNPVPRTVGVAYRHAQAQFAPQAHERALDVMMCA